VDVRTVALGFYPPGLSQKRELEFASRALASIEINGASSLRLQA